MFRLPSMAERVVLISRLRLARQRCREIAEQLQNIRERNEEARHRLFELHEQRIREVLAAQRRELAEVERLHALLEAEEQRFNRAQEERRRMVRVARAHFEALNLSEPKPPVKNGSNGGSPACTDSD